MKCAEKPECPRSRKKELGAVGAVYFLRQFSTGRGDCTAGRDALLQGITLDEIIRNVRESEE